MKTIKLPKEGDKKFTIKVVEITNAPFGLLTKFNEIESFKLLNIVKLVYILFSHL